MVKSTLSQLVKYVHYPLSAYGSLGLLSGLYMCIMDNCDIFCDQLEACMDAVMEAQSFKDPAAVSNKDPLGSQIIASLASVFFE